MSLTSLHIAYVRYGPDRASDPHLTRIVPGDGHTTLCGRAVLGYGPMVADDSSPESLGPDICDACRKVVAPD